MERLVKRTLFVCVFVALLMAGAACSAALPERDQAVEPTPAHTKLPAAEEDAMGTPTPPPGLSDDAQAVVERARQDLAQRLDVQPEVVRLVDVEPVEWPNAALGCPQPDTMYAQVITPGFRVTLQVQDEVYSYHADRGERVILCQD
jgi:hypothetical protein